MSMDSLDKSRRGDAVQRSASQGSRVAGDATSRGQARNGEGMLPNLRFVIGAILATAFLGAASVGLFATVRSPHQAKVGPLEASRTEAFGDRADWNQFADPDAARRFGSLTRMAEAIEIMPQPAPAEPTPAAPPAAAPAGDDHQSESVPRGCQRAGRHRGENRRAGGAGRSDAGRHGERGSARSAERELRRSPSRLPPPQRRWRRARPPRSCRARRRQSLSRMSVLHRRSPPPTRRSPTSRARRLRPPSPLLIPLPPPIPLLPRQSLSLRHRASNRARRRRSRSPLPLRRLQSRRPHRTRTNRETPVRSAPRRPRHPARRHGTRSRVRPEPWTPRSQALIRRPRARHRLPPSASQSRRCPLPTPPRSRRRRCRRRPHRCGQAFPNRRRRNRSPARRRRSSSTAWWTMIRRSARRADAWCVGRNTCRRGPRHNHNHMTPNGTGSSRNTHRGKPAPGISSGNPTAASTDASE